jgi:hypothetical protein
VILKLRDSLFQFLTSDHLCVDQSLDILQVLSLLRSVEDRVNL